MRKQKAEEAPAFGTRMTGILGVVECRMWNVGCDFPTTCPDGYDITSYCTMPITPRLIIHQRSFQPVSKLSPLPAAAYPAGSHIYATTV